MPKATTATAVNHRAERMLVLSRCPHSSSFGVTKEGVVLHRGQPGAIRLVCWACGRSLPIGRSKDGDPRVQLEIRLASELGKNQHLAALTERIVRDELAIEAALTELGQQ